MSQCLQHPDTGFQIQGSNKPNKLLKQQVKDFFTLWKIFKSPSKQKVTFYPFYLEYLNFQSYIPLYSQQAEETKKKQGYGNLRKSPLQYLSLQASSKINMSNKYIYKKLWGWLKQDQYYCTYKNPGLWQPCYSSFKYIYTGVNTYFPFGF